MGKCFWSVVVIVLLISIVCFEQIIKLIWNFFEKLFQKVKWKKFCALRQIQSAQNPTTKENG